MPTNTKEKIVLGFLIFIALVIFFVVISRYIQTDQLIKNNLENQTSISRQSIPTNIPTQINQPLIEEQTEIDNLQIDPIDSDIDDLQKDVEAL